MAVCNMRICCVHGQHAKMLVQMMHCTSSTQSGIPQFMIQLPLAQNTTAQNTNRHPSRSLKDPQCISSSASRYEIHDPKAAFPRMHKSILLPNGVLARIGQISYIFSCELCFNPCSADVVSLDACDHLHFLWDTPPHSFCQHFTCGGLRHFDVLCAFHPDVPLLLAHVELNIESNHINLLLCHEDGEIPEVISIQITILELQIVVVGKWKLRDTATKSVFWPCGTQTCKKGQMEGRRSCMHFHTVHRTATLCI